MVDPVPTAWAAAEADTHIKDMEQLEDSMRSQAVDTSDQPPLEAWEFRNRAERGHDPAELLGGESTAHAVTRLQRWPLPLRATEPAWPRASSSRSRDHELD